MSLRHDDELPPLTHAQQVEAIRIAARLQAEHEAQASNEALLLAAEEAGIERRFLHEAVRRLPRAEVARKTSSRVSPVAGLGLLFATVLVFVLSLKAIPIATAGIVLLLVSFLFALPPTSLGRPRDRTALQVFLAWVATDLVFMVYMAAHANLNGFEWPSFFGGLALALSLQAFAAFAGTELARGIYRLSARLEKLRPRSL